MPVGSYILRCKVILLSQLYFALQSDIAIAVIFCFRKVILLSQLYLPCGVGDGAPTSRKNGSYIACGSLTIILLSPLGRVDFANEASKRRERSCFRIALQVLLFYALLTSIVGYADTFPTGESKKK